MAGQPTKQSVSRSLVSATADRLRDRVFSEPPGTLLGSLQDLTAQMGVGTVTLQQAARVLEHEGLLEARRGPGGGYYGARPGDAALERAFAAYMRTHPASYDEALEITSLLFIELAAAAADCQSDPLRAELALLAARIEGCDGDAERGAFERELQDLLFRMVRRPLFELLTRVTLGFAMAQSERLLRTDPQAVQEWKDGRYRIVDAIQRADRDLARFEASRSNRRLVLEGLSARRGVTSR